MDIKSTYSQLGKMPKIPHDEVFHDISQTQKKTMDFKE